MLRLVQHIGVGWPAETTMTKNKCAWVFGKRKCKNTRHRNSDKFCENHLQLERQVAGYRKARAFLVAAGKLVSDAEEKVRHEIYGEYVSGCAGWASQLDEMTRKLNWQIMDMDTVWDSKALPELERKSMSKAPDDS